MYPFISVIVASYNSASTIRMCLDSLVEMDYPKDRYEVIVVDNNSTDQSYSIVKEYPFIFFQELKQSPAASRNAGLRIAKGRVGRFFDSDQYAEKTYLKELIKGIDDPKIGAVAGTYQFLKNEDDLTATRYLHNEAEAQLQDEAQLKVDISKGVYAKIGAGNVLYRKEVLEKLKGFDESLFSSEDFDLAFRMQAQLGYQVKFNHQAIAWHVTRSSDSLVKREFRIGSGDYVLGTKHPVLKKNLLRLFVNALKRTCVGLLSIVKNVFILNGQNIKLTWLDIRMQWSNLFGRLYSKWNKTKYEMPADW